MKRILFGMSAALVLGCGAASAALSLDLRLGPVTVAVGADTPLLDPSPLVRDCTWVSHDDPDLMNIFFPDTAAHYWLGAVAIPPGGKVRIEGEFPHARYMSFNLYDPTLAPFDSLNDRDIVPDKGHTNPFRSGANRNAAKRKYSVTVVADPAPADPAKRAPNTLYAGIAGVPVPGSVLMYRVYVPDRDASLDGGVGLPRVRYYLPGGIELGMPGICSLLEATRLGLGLNETLASLNLSDVPVPLSAKNPLDWKRFFNPGLVVVEALGRAGLASSPIYDSVRQLLLDSGWRGGFMSNRDNQYVTSTINNNQGQLVVLASRVPTTPKTYDKQAVMGGAQLRYLSLCSNDFPTQRFWDCLYDEEIPRDASGNFVVVISHADQRPANARPECGVAWLNWGPLGSSALILRNMLPAPDFTHAVQNIQDLDAEHEVMGEYYPFGTYSSRAAFESLSADPRGSAPNCKLDLQAVRAFVQAAQ
jgi:hypothetical protein